MAPRTLEISALMFELGLMIGLAVRGQWRVQARRCRIHAKGIARGYDFKS